MRSYFISLKNTAPLPTISMPVTSLENTKLFSAVYDGSQVCSGSKRKGAFGENRSGAKTHCRDQCAEKHIANYSKTRDIYVPYRKAGYSKKFLQEHEPDIIIHKAAKKAFDELGVKKLPTVKSLQVEFADLLSEKKSAYAELKKLREELRELTVHTANYEELRDLEQRENDRQAEHDRTYTSFASAKSSVLASSFS